MLRVYATLSFDRHLVPVSLARLSQGTQFWSGPSTSQPSSGMHFGGIRNRHVLQFRYWLGCAVINACR